MRGIEFHQVGRRAEFVPPLQGGGIVFYDLDTRAFSPGYNITGFQPSTTATLKGRHVTARAEGPGISSPQLFKPCQDDTTMHHQTRPALDAESAELLGNIKALV